MEYFTRQGQKAFTLIELLVVVAIISLISSIAMASLNSARTKAQQLKVSENVRAIRNAIEIYYADKGEFPAWEPNPDRRFAAQASAPSWAARMAVFNGYLSEIPKKEGAALEYFIISCPGNSPGFICYGTEIGVGSDADGSCLGTGTAGYIIQAWGVAPDLASSDGGAYAGVYELWGGSAFRGHKDGGGTCLPV